MILRGKINCTPIRPAQIEMVANDFFEKLPSAGRSIQHLGQAHFHLPDTEPVIGAGAAVLFLQPEGEYAAAGNTPLFARLKELLGDEPGRISQAEIAAQLAMTENAVKDVPPISPTLPAALARGNRTHRRDTRRHRG